MNTRQRQSYWKVYHAARERYDFTPKEARQFVREFADVLERAPTGKDMERHPRYAKRAAREVTLAEAAEPVTRRVAGGFVKRGRRVEREYFEEPVEYEEYEITATTKGHTPRRR